MLIVGCCCCLATVECDGLNGALLMRVGWLSLLAMSVVRCVLLAADWCVVCFCVVDAYWLLVVVRC